MNRSILTVLYFAFSTFSVYAQEAPVYNFESSILTVPYANADGIPGMFQNIEIEYANGDLWRLVDFWDPVEFSPNFISSVELIEIDSHPVQMYLKIIGFYGPSCYEPGQVIQNREGNLLKINFYYLENAFFESDEPVACPAETDELDLVIPLDVYGLDAGVYEYSLNGDFEGVFTLDSDNVLEN